ncbi:ArsR-like helix-turn-helix domain-containing protein [Dioscorea alata]|uniref:ArsR-like helix-turn-helix domain-containing protein n=1 Tax=Dioscorea alata TaxID=55571 RepID=A0ACB7VB03_DIOAL|nr:ArsR-like helix-turn-helix domain-containing protein [Dioscorea alata]
MIFTGSFLENQVSEDLCDFFRRMNGFRVLSRIGGRHEPAPAELSQFHLFRFMWLFRSHRSCPFHSAEPFSPRLGLDFNLYKSLAVDSAPGSRFYSLLGCKGFPKFQKHCRVSGAS